MAKLYLIRRKLESFVGPLTAEDIQDSFERMEFGLQDEVSGDCGRWVILENKKALQRYYPEIFPLIYKGKREVWSSAAPSGPPVKKKKSVKSSKDLTVRARKKNKSSKSRPPSPLSREKKGKKLALILLLLGSSAIAVALYLVKQENLVIKIPFFSSKPELAQMKRFFREGDLPGFTGYVDQHQKLLVSDVLNQAGGAEMSPWLPYLRFYAFQGEGQIAGLPASVLKGREAMSAPSSCSMETWLKHWKSSSGQWSAMVFGRKLVKSPAGRILGWDPHWVRRREAKGWLEPVNYYGACIFMAYRSFEYLMNDTDFVATYLSGEPDAALVMDVIRGRIGWLSYAANGTNTFTGIIPGTTDKGFLAPSYWSCLEASGSYSELDSCQRGYQSSDGAWKVFEKDRLANNLIRLTFGEKKKVPSKILLKLGKSRKNIMRNDPFTRFDFRPEIRYLDLLLQNKGDVSRTLNKVNKEYPSIVFK